MGAALEDLGSSVGQSTRLSNTLKASVLRIIVLVRFEFRGKTEVEKLGSSVSGNANVFRFEVTVNYVVSVQACEALCNIGEDDKVF
mmetsp:Transcript_7881/g.15645  ORF Transcript_7881/g.15645 Transcript_7881/m.15645 type:complete len:86 (-) Transcript_7881:1439-1696(-)